MSPECIITAQPGRLPFDDEEREVDDATDVQYLWEVWPVVEDGRFVGLGPEMEAIRRYTLCLLTCRMWLVVFVEKPTPVDVYKG